MKKTTKTTRKLSLNREVLVALSAHSLEHIAAADSAICSASGVCVCDTAKSCTTGTADDIKPRIGGVIKL